MSNVSIGGLVPDSKRSEPTQVTEQIVPISSIFVSPERSRKEYNNIRELAESIAAIGLMHPLFCTALPDGKYELIGGGRRFRAIIALGWKNVPIRLGSEFTEVERAVAELAENHDREPLTAIEEIDNLRKIDEAKRKIYGDGGKGTVVEGSVAGWTKAKTAEFVHQSPQRVSEKLAVADILKRPENADIREAVKDLPMMALMRKVKEMDETKKLVGQHEKKELLINKDLRHGDAVELIKTLADNSVDLIVNDPPFGMDEIQESVGETFDSSANYTAFLKETDNLSFEDACNLLKKLIPEYFRVLKPSSHGYIFGSMQLYRDFLYKELVAAGFEVPQAPIIWDKTRSTTQFMGTNYPSSYEVIAFFNKPDKDGFPVVRLSNTKSRNILSFAPVSSGKRIHRFQKPDELLMYLIENSTVAGQTVLDPTAGSGSTLKAALRLKRNAIGFERDMENFVRAQAFLAMKD